MLIVIFVLNSLEILGPKNYKTDNGLTCYHCGKFFPLG